MANPNHQTVTINYLIKKKVLQKRLQRNGHTYDYIHYIKEHKSSDNNIFF